MYNKCCPELRLPNCPEEFGCPRSLTRIIPEQTDKIKFPNTQDQDLSQSSRYR